MKQIDVNDYKGLKEAIEENTVDDAVLFTENGEEKYVLMDIDVYDELIQEALMIEASNTNRIEDMNLKVDVIDQNGYNAKLSLEEYEELKEKVVEALEKQFKPETKYN